jgi:hypothetical protein
MNSDVARVWRTVLTSGVKNCAKVVIFMTFFEIRKCSLFVPTTCEFNDEIMKIGYLNKKFQVKKLSMNLPVIKREKQIFKV